MGSCVRPEPETACRVLPSPGIDTGYDEAIRPMWKTATRSTVLCLLALAAVGTPPAHAQETAPGAGMRDPLAGRWKLNRALSDDPAEQLRAMGMPEGAPRARPGQGGPPPSSRGRGAFAALRANVDGFEIERTDSTVSIAYPDHQLRLFTDGRKQKIEGANGREVEYRARWAEGKLLLERRLDGGLLLSEEYIIQPGTGRLHVLTRLEGDRLPMPVAFVRVYDPADG